jgi:four helix bundle protein
MNQNKNPNTTFIALELSLDLVRTVRPLVDRIARFDAGLARQVRDAITVVPGHIGEANRRVGRDRTHLFRVVEGSVDEARIHLRTAEAMGYLELDDLAPALALADRVIAVVWRLKTGSRRA